MENREGVIPNQPPHEVVSSVLSFYGSQLTSHASLMIGFVVALFALVQAHALLVEWVFQFAAVSIVSAVIYSMFRIVLYGSLSGVVLHGLVADYALSLVSVREERFVHGLVDRFAASQLIRTTLWRGALFRLYGGFSKWADRRVSFWIQPPHIISVVAGITVVGVMFGWSVYMFFWSYWLLAVIVTSILGLSLRFARRRPAAVSL